VSGGVVDKAELVKWWDALRLFTAPYVRHNVAEGVRLARECRHPEAHWLVSLFPATPR
jgi:hypothetical protein